MIKKALREILIGLRLDLTDNLRYDRLTRAVLKKAVKPGSNIIDVGCHQGEILEQALRLSPQGQHTGFEPIPYLYDALQEKFGDKAAIYSTALYDQEGESEFFIVRNEPGYSGLRRRSLEFTPDYQPVRVSLKRLDGFFPGQQKIHFIKLDVEGAELQVLKGAQALLLRDKPVILFECGRGGYDYFNESPMEIHRFLSGLGYTIFEMEDWLKRRPGLTETAFQQQFDRNDNYYFIAS
ncbi:MAG: FkbM family methyltransferase [Bacteroidetes bacterium]|nr:FkbM family methyltransferase [Bacteroidota bacterium]